MFSQCENTVRTGIQHLQKPLSQFFLDEDRKRIAAKAQSEAKSIDLSVVRLMFIAYLPDSQGAFTIMLKPIISDAIFDSSKCMLELS